MLAGVYRSAANSLPSVTTVGELYATLQKAIATAGVPPPAPALPTMRQLIAAELNKRLPTDADRQLTLKIATGSRQHSGLWLIRWRQ